MKHRIIARLDIKGPNLVKGIHLEGLRVLGDPYVFAEYYSKCGADELLYMDVVASLYGRNSIHELISKTARTAFIPTTVGGGLRTIEDIQDVLRAGADKVSINTAAIHNPDFITRASRYFGRSTIAVTIEAIQKSDGNYYAFVDNGREETHREVISWAQEVVERGAGEIIITSVDKEGTGEGFDIELTKSVSLSVGVPVVACGGAGKSSHVAEVIEKGKADAVAIASIIHYDVLAKKKSTFMESKREGNTIFAQSERKMLKIDTLSIPEMKKYLCEQHIPVRS